MVEIEKCNKLFTFFSKMNISKKRDLITQIKIVEPYLSRENKKLYRILQDKIQKTVALDG